MPPPLAPYHGGAPYPPNSHVIHHNGYDIQWQNKSTQQHGVLAKQHPSPAKPKTSPPKTKSQIVRPLTVNEALQFSPLSSIVPFESGIIALPHARNFASSSIFADLSEEQTVEHRRQLKYLDDGAKVGGSGTTRDILGGVQSLLDPTRISEFQFKAKPASLRTPQVAVRASRKLSSFASMVLKHTEVEYTTPHSTRSKSPQLSPSTIELKPSIEVRVPKRPSTSTTSQPILYSEKRVAQNEIANLPIDTINLAQTSVQPSVVISSTQLSLPPNLYKTYEPGVDMVEPRKRKRGDEDIRDGGDQRAIADAALQSFKETLWEIFDAEDHFEVRRDMNTDENILFLVRGLDGDLPTLTASTHVRLESDLQKIISVHRFQNVSVEEIARIHKLSEGALIAADSIDGRIQPGWAEDEVVLWLDSLEIVETAFRSSRTILRTMAGSREESRLYPEDLLQKIIGLLTKVTDSCLVRVVESRKSNDPTSIFCIAEKNVQVLQDLLLSARKIMDLLFDVISKQELSDQPINDILFFTIRMLFVENSPSEKESIIGVQNFEKFRKTSMNIISQIYSHYDDQREFIVREVLESLQKLPTKQHARQYKLRDGPRMQLTTVLLVRLVSTSGTPGASGRQRKTPHLLLDIENGSKDDATSDDDEPLAQKLTTENFVPDNMRRLAKKLYNTASQSAQRIINFLVHRASSCSKSGEVPHRHLLDLFVEDLVGVLNFPDWPAAELLLRALVGRMIELAEAAQTAATVRTMALELLGVIGSAILDVTIKAKQISRTLETDNSKRSEQLSLQLDNSLDGSLDMWDIAGRDGPYQLVLEHLSNTKSDVQGYHLTQWIKVMFWGSSPTSSNAQVPEINCAPFATRVCKALSEGRWEQQDDNFPVSQSQCMLAYHLILLNVAVCRAFGRIVSVLVNSIKSDQVTVRARGIRSVTLIVEKDPSLLDRMSQIHHTLLRCASDTSSSVRDSALALIGKGVSFKESIDSDLLKPILAGTRDPAVVIKKRTLKQLKDIFVREPNTKELKITISESLLQRVDDAEESVSDLARQLLEEAWMSPFWAITRSTELSLHDRVALKAQFGLIAWTIDRSEVNSLLLGKFLRYSMSRKCKAHVANTQVDKALVAIGFECVIDDIDEPGPLSQRSVLQCLTVFAQANPELFTAQQLEHLKPYVGNLSGADDLNLFRRVVIILRCVLPTLSTVQKDFLKRIQDDLFQNVSKLAKAELNEVAACLWTINGVLGNISRLVNLEISVLSNLHKMESLEFTASSSPKDLTSRAQRLIYLAGHFGQHCNFEPELKNFRSKLAWLREDSVPSSIVAAFKPFFHEKQPLSLRIVAMEGIGMLCQSWPQNFNEQGTMEMLRNALNNDHRDIQKIVLSSFRKFYVSQDPKFLLEEDTEEKEVLIDGKIGGSVIATEMDNAAALIAQGFYRDIIRISLQSQDDYALAATEVMASIVRQGLVHPKECGPALVALTTSENSRIADIALQQHQTLHLQHESMFEREYMRAIQLAYQYQQRVAHDSRGLSKPAYRPKLYSMYEVIKTSKAKVQSKFLSNYCLKIDFDLIKLDISSEPPTHFDYARFLIENLALFDYARMEDLLQVIASCEKIVSNTGSAVAHAINTDILKIIIDPQTGVPLNAPQEKDQINIEIPASRLRLLTTASMILSMLWQARTFLRRLYNINDKENRKEGRGRPSKDQNKVPPKNNTATGEKFAEAVEKISYALDSQDQSVQQCKEFAQLMAIDSELKVADEDDESAEVRHETPSMDGEGDSVVDPGSATKVSKRKSSVSLNGTPHKKKRGRPPLNGARRNSKKNLDDDDDDWE